MRGMRTAGAGIVAAAVLATVLTGCSAGEADDRPSVYVTTNILGDVVAELAGDELEVVNLMAPGADPHSFELSAQQVAGMRDAELIVTNGLGLEEGLLQHVEAAAAEDVEVFAAGDHVDVLEYSDSGGPDPHFWTDPAQMLLVIDALAPELAELASADGAARIEQATADYRAALVELDEQIADDLAAIPAQNRALVTNHHVFGYLARRHDVTLLGAAIPGGTTLAAPSTSDLQELVDAIDESGVSTIFAESSSPDQLVQVLADEADRDVAVVELLTESLAPAGEPGDSYLDMLRVNTERISEGLTP
jgi:zinc/manganese transport system substrate-binding protein